MESKEQKRSFYLDLLVIAIPITVQQLVSSSGSIIDNLMVSSLGSKSIGAVGAVNKFIQIYWYTMFGLTSGGASFVAQYAARDDLRGVRKTLGVTLILNLTVSIIFTALSLFNSSSIASLFTSDPEALLIAKKYLLAMVPYYIISAIPYTFSYPLRSLGKAHLAMYVMFFSQAVNIVLNYLLIGGNYGFPALGVVGAALATVASKVVEASLMLGIIYWKQYAVAAKMRELLSFTGDFLRKYLTVVAPLAVNEILWSLGLMFYQILIGGIDANAIAAYGMLAPFEQLLINGFSGLSNAALNMVGRELGKEEYEEAYSRGMKFVYIGPAIAILLGFFAFIFADKAIAFYLILAKDSSLISSKALKQAANLLKILGSLMFIRIFNMISFAGVLKSGGDTKFLFLVETCSLWILGVPLVYISVKLGLGVEVAYLATYLEEMAKAVLIWRRLISKKWMNTLIEL